MKVHTVVAGTDGSDNAWKALEAAAAVVADGGVVHVVSAFEPLSSHAATEILSGLPKDFANIYDPFASVRLLLQDSADYFKNRNIRCETHTSDDDPASAILDLADEVDADLIVVGSRGLGRGRRFIHGSVSSRVATHARRSYLVVHHAED
jgi:nucleotide-binding universal stress UspA family protein